MCWRCGHIRRIVALVPRPAPDPALVEKALKLRDQGYSDEEVGAELGLGARTVRRWALAREGRRDVDGAKWGARPEARPAAAPQGGNNGAIRRRRGKPGPAPKQPLAGARRRAAAPPPAPPKAQAPPVPGDLDGPDADLWILDHEIGQVRDELAQARAAGRTHGLAALGKHLADLLERRADLRPPPPPTEDAEERRWRQDADAVLRKIRAGLEGRA